MLQGILEAVFYSLYLITAFGAGIYLCLRGTTVPTRAIGIAALLLAVGDAAYLVPRVVALFSTSSPALNYALGVGKAFSSVTLTLSFAAIYFAVCAQKNRFSVMPTVLAATLTFARLMLLCFPQNEWFAFHPDWIWRSLRNLPLILVGAIVAWQCLRAKDVRLKQLGIAVALSFLFYLPAVYLSDRIPLLGLLMIPKSIAYLWMICVGVQLHVNPPDIVRIS